ncbi:transporter [Aureibaculum sp. 2210JD6-5]|uniref:transporter n=1 Tax=Aureibaculum sp. 2210JD6-5 TaxID=3103957 RepID=UPI002AACD635|nr:transporter [Aureibaculum sp. 2210JD6-5]MDY7395938.1 transporter [Aureibaculum sp. 2210JD6-5]
MTKYYSILLIFIVVELTAQVEDKAKKYGELITDRPDQTESPSVVPKGFLQVETGTFFEKVKNNNIENESKTYNTTLLRYGLLENLELRFGLDFMEQSRAISGTKLEDIASGFSPLLLGVKVGITEEKGLLPEIGLLGHLSLPFSASKDYKPENTGVDFRFAFSHTLNEKSSISYNLGAAWGDDSPEAAYVYTLVYGNSITEKLGVYVELYGDMPENNKANHLWDMGFTYLVSDNIQLDISGGTGISRNIQDLLLSAGISFRIPK